MTTKFKVGDLVIDRDGYKGAITKVTEFKGSHWYDMRWYLNGCTYEAVRYDSDLEPYEVLR